MMALPGPAFAQTVFTVNTTTDLGGGSPDGTCDALPTTAGDQCTLREAIVEANDAANTNGPDVIEFDIGGTASPSSPHFLGIDTPLPDITDPVEIDGTSSPDYGSLPVIQVDGTNAGTGADAFSVAFALNGGGELILRGMSITNFEGTAVVLSDGRNQIRSCHIGVEPDGLTPGGNGRGLFLGSGTDDSIISDNIISANARGAISLTSASRITNNRIGVDRDDNDLGNQVGSNPAAVNINTSGALIQGNVIAYNEGNAVTVTSLTPPDIQNEITGNAIQSNTGVGIDLEGGTEDADGRTANDAGDADDGPNRLQNYPEIQSAIVSSGDVTLTYLVDSDPTLTSAGASAYPLTINLYRADADQEEGFGIVGQDTYTATDHGGCGTPPCTKTITVTSLIGVTQSDFITATATDANGNTSELSAPSSQLPVEFAGIDAQPSGDTEATLTWSTLSETGNDGFYIERRVDAAAFADVGFRKGAGTTTETQRYRFVDRDVPFGAERVTYRLRQVDVDGDVQRSEPVAVTFGAGKTLELGAPRPNPATTQATVNVTVPKNVEDAELVLFDLLGRPVRRINTSALQGRAPLQVSTEGLAAGTYIFRLTGAGQSVAQKVTVVR